MKTFGEFELIKVEDFDGFVNSVSYASDYKEEK